MNRGILNLRSFILIVAGGLLLVALPPSARPEQQTDKTSADSVADAQTPKEVPIERPEQKKTNHDRSDAFDPAKASPTSQALVDQQDHGQFLGFDFYRDPLGAMKPGVTFEEVFKTLSANKPKVV